MNDFDWGRTFGRYLRYNVEGWYNLDSKEILRRWKGEDKEWE